MAYYSSADTYGRVSPPRVGGGYLPPSPLTPAPMTSRLVSPVAPVPTISPRVAPPAPTPTRPAIDLSNLDYSSDPVLARIKALGEQQVKEAEAEGLRQRTQLAIGFGDVGFAKSLGLKGDVLKQTGENPFSTTQELARGKTRRDVFNINRPLSDQANLFYSSERGRQLSLSGEQYLRDQAQAMTAVQERAAQISQAVLQAKLDAQAKRIQAEQDAYQRALSLAMTTAGW